MDEDNKTFTFTFKADTKHVKKEMKDLSDNMTKFNVDVGQAFKGVFEQTRSVKDGFKALGHQIASQAFKKSLAPIDSFLNGKKDQNKGLINSIFGFAKGGSIGSGISSGVIKSPIAFPLGGNSLGIAGESGPEAILPLARGANGELGVHSSGAGNQTIVNVNITATDIESFRRSEAEVATSLQRIVSRSSRNL